MYVLTKQQRIAELARRSPQMGFTSLAYLMDIDWLKAAFHRTRKDGAPGVDGQTWHDYERNLEANLQSLLDRAKSGTYRAPPVRRVYIPKAGSTTETRPIGIPTLEDKVLQRAVVMLLEPIYEQDFDAGSYGFRPGRSAHDALEDLWKRTMDSSGGWILEVDIRKFFDTLGHAHLREFLQLRVRDGVLKRLIGKWLKAGVMEEGSVSYPDAGSPQGGVISPLLANVFLHYVLDVWFRQEVQPRLRGRAHLIRYADDFVILFRHEDDARRVMEVLPKRFGKYGLTLHPDKTRLVPFRRPPRKAVGGTDDRDEPTRHVRPLGFYPLLGPNAARRVGGDAEDGREATEPSGAEHCGMVSEQPAPPGLRAARNTESESARTLRVLRDHRQHSNVEGVPSCSPSRMAEVA